MIYKVPGRTLFLRLPEVSGQQNSGQMKQDIAHIALVVRDYDERIQLYMEKLEFKLLEDTRLSEDKRWVLVAPKGAKRNTVSCGQSSG